MLDRIKEFFRNAFGGNEQKYIEAPKVNHIQWRGAKNSKATKRF